jgi:uncharacterized protein (TIGR03437 family)
VLLRFCVFIPAAALLAAAPSLPATDTPWPAASWFVSTPEAQGLDSARLERASQFIVQKCPTRYSLLVVRHGRIAFERYYHGTRASDANNICSISKSIVSVLVGIAMSEGKLRSVDQKVKEFFPEYVNAHSDPRARQIRLRDLLTMTAGYQWADLGPGGSPGGDMSRCLATSNWLRCMLEAPMKLDPGTAFNYDTGLTHTVAAILARTTGMTARSYATRRLFSPLGISCPRWTHDPLGYSTGGWDVWMTVRDLARFGLLVLRNGEWCGRQIVSAEWLDTSTRLRVRTGKAGWGFGGYGYFWWKKTLAGYPVTLASGYGGQNIFLIPELDLLVVTTARSDRTPPIEAYQQSYDILSQYVLPAVTADAPAIQAQSIVQTADGSSPAAGSFATATGSGFSLVERDWDYAMPMDGRLPECIAGACVDVDGRVAHVRYVRPDRVDFLLPPDLSPGRHAIRIRTPQGNSATAVDVAATAPALFVTARGGRLFAGDGPVRPGGLLSLRASGLGPSAPPAVPGMAIAQPLPLATQPQVWVGGRRATVTEAVLAEAGVCRIGIRAPEGLAPGVSPVLLCSGAACSRSEAMVEIAPE